jgi:serine/threonine-protein kinase SRPK3
MESWGHGEPNTEQWWTLLTPRVRKIWDLAENETLFNATDPDGGDYRAALHLKEMVGLLGPPPEDLLQRGKTSTSYFTAGG